MNLNPLAAPTFILSFILFWLGKTASRKVTARAGRLTLLILAMFLSVPGCLFVLYYAHVFDRAAWFYYFRALPYSELAASGIGFLGGIVQYRLQPNTSGEKMVLPTLLGLLLFVPFLKPALDPVDYSQLRSACMGDVCLQSTGSTCGPSSAATILKLLGQSSSEKELARESFTSRGGTEIWYIARAFRRRGFRADFVFQSPDLLAPPSPSIAGVLLPGGAGHFIAVLSDTGDELIVGDPLKGKLVLPKTQLRSAYHYTGLFLVIRKHF